MFQLFKSKKGKIIGFSAIALVVIIIGILIGVGYNNNLNARTEEAYETAIIHLDKITDYQDKMDEEEQNWLAVLDKKLEDSKSARDVKKLEEIPEEVSLFISEAITKRSDDIKKISLDIEATIEQSKQLEELKTKHVGLIEENPFTADVEKAKKEVNELATKLNEEIRTAKQLRAEEEAARIAAEEEAARIEAAARLQAEQEEIDRLKGELENQTQNYGNIVTSQTGTKYHYSDCHTLKKPGNPTTPEEAKANGYEPCKVCHPPQ